MKKLIAIILAITLLLLATCLSACSTNPEDKLIGTWVSDLGSGDQLYSSIMYSFYKSGDTYAGRMSGGYYGSSVSTSFTYVIEGNELVLTLDNGSTLRHSYSISGDTITIDGMQFVKE